MAKLQQDEDKDLPGAHLLANHVSLFLELKGLSVHYKSMEGGVFNKVPLRNTYERHELPQYTRSSSSKSSPIFSGGWNTALALNGWPALMQQTHRGTWGMPSIPTSQGSGEIQGKSSGVVFIHGFGGGVFSWRHVMGTVAREVGCRVVAFDRPGWGLTTRPQKSEWEQKGLPNPYELHTQVDLLFAFCEELGLTSVVLVGHSDGGLLALMAAAKTLKSRESIQVEVKGLVLVSVDLAREVVPSFARVLLHTTLGSHMLRPLLRSEIVLVTTGRRAWHDASKLTSETLDLYKTPLHVENWDKALLEVSKATSATAVLSALGAADLVRCGAGLPALVVTGVQDNLVPIKSAESLTSQLPSSRLVAIPSCGHLPHEECPGALLSVMVPFVSSYLNNDAVHSKSRSPGNTKSADPSRCSTVGIIKNRTVQFSEKHGITSKAMGTFKKPAVKKPSANDETLIATAQTSETPSDEFIQLTILCGHNLEVGMFGCMSAIAVAWMNPRFEVNTLIDFQGGCNPFWNYKVWFTCDDSSINGTITVDIYNHRLILGDKLVGTVRVPLADFPCRREATSESGKLMTYPVQTPSGRFQGVLNVSIKGLQRSEIEQANLPFPQLIIMPAGSMETGYPGLDADTEIGPCGWIDRVVAGILAVIIGILAVIIGIPVVIFIGTPLYGTFYLLKDLHIF